MENEKNKKRWGRGGEFSLQSAPKTEVPHRRRSVSWQHRGTVRLLLSHKICYGKEKVTKEKWCVSSGGMCAWHSCHSPFEKCIQAIAEVVGLSLRSQSRDHHPMLSRGCCLYLRCATVTHDNAKRRPVRPPSHRSLTSSRACGCSDVKYTSMRRRDNNLSEEATGIFFMPLGKVGTACIVLHAHVHTWLLAETPSAWGVDPFNTFCSQKLEKMKATV